MDALPEDWFFFVDEDWLATLWGYTTMAELYALRQPPPNTNLYNFILREEANRRPCRVLAPHTVHQLANGSYEVNYPWEYWGPADANRVADWGDVSQHIGIMGADLIQEAWEERMPPYVVRTLSTSEFVWYYTGVLQRITSRRMRFFVATLGNPTAEEALNPESEAWIGDRYASAYAGRLRALDDWATRMQDIDVFDRIVTAWSGAGVADHGVMLRLTYNRVTCPAIRGGHPLHYVSVPHRGAAVPAVFEIQWPQIVHGVEGPETTTWVPLRPHFAGVLRWYIWWERRRRSYSSDTQYRLVAGGPHEYEYADLYLATDEAPTDRWGVVYPSSVAYHVPAPGAADSYLDIPVGAGPGTPAHYATYLAGPVHGRHVADRALWAGGGHPPPAADGGGAWCPVYLTAFVNAPDRFKDWLGHKLQLYVNREHLLQHHDMVLHSTRPEAAGCFHHAILENQVLSAHEEQVLAQTFLAFLRQSAQGFASGFLTLRQVDALVRMFFAMLAAAPLPPADPADPAAPAAPPLGPLFFELKYERGSPSVLLHWAMRRRDDVVAQGVRETFGTLNKDVKRIGDANAVGRRVIKVGLIAGHFFANVTTRIPDFLPRGIRKLGLESYLNASEADRRAWDRHLPLFEYTLACNVRRTDRSNKLYFNRGPSKPQALDPFEFLETIFRHRDTLQWIDRHDPDIFAKLDSHGTLFDHPTFTIPVAPAVLKGQWRYTLAVSPVQRRIARARPVLDLVMDVEDTPDSHKPYVIALGRVPDVPNNPLTAAALPVQSWTFPLDGSPVDLGITFREGVLPMACAGLQRDAPLSDEAVDWLLDENRRNRVPPAGEEEGAFLHIPQSTNWGWTRSQLATIAALLVTPVANRTAEMRKKVRRLIPYPREVRIFTHNLTYDLAVLAEAACAAGGRLPKDGYLPKGNRVVTARVFFPKWNVLVHFVDSLRLFGGCMGVAKLAEAFGFAAGGEHVGKQMFLHEWMTDPCVLQHIKHDGRTDMDRLRHLATACDSSHLCLTRFDYPKFEEQAKDFVEGDRIRILDYARHYCEWDVRLVAEALLRWNELVKQVSDGKIQAKNFLSASSIADGLYKVENCYERTVELGGMFDTYFRNFVVGGRSATAWNWKCFRVDEAVTPMDANSLYPTAMYELSKQLGGMLCGPPTQIEPLRYPTMRDVEAAGWDGYFVVLSPPVRSAAPPPHQYPIGLLGRRRCDKGGQAVSLEWINDPRRPDGAKEEDYFLRVSRVSWEDLRRHLPMYKPEDFRVVSGYYFASGRNPALGDVVLRLYTARLAASDAALKNAIKYLLNGAYGKLLQLPVTTQVSVFEDLGGMFETCRRQWSHVVSASPMLPTRGAADINTTDRGPFLLTTRRPFLQHYGRPHLAAEVLDMARAVMNRSLTPFLPDSCRDAEEPPARPPSGVIDDPAFLSRLVLYTDTDSLHVVSRAMDHFPGGLDGPLLGQFKNDLGAGASARRAIVIWKKIYILDRDPPHAPRYALKGIPDAALHYQALQAAQDPTALWEGVYEPLCRGESLRFHLGVTNSSRGGAHRPQFRVDRRAGGIRILNGPDDPIRVVSVAPQVTEPDLPSDSESSVDHASAGDVSDTDSSA